ncbi:hypothetical protein BG011_004029 [Mortierella polycephala]|uniref:RNB domain-containing protein n=1 Tax=Mortierella polycephala TaxID=41804 RepID=A0A9P6Q2X2_9FUNG|nr:hypothetical protein BG011_004029 [Mortierella polycephala]
MYARKISEKNARKARKEKVMQLLAIKKANKEPNAQSNLQFVKPYSVDSDIGELFGPESVQKRDVLPGDFVEVRKDGKAVYGIYIQHFDQAEGRLLSSTMTNGDYILEHRTADVVFRIPGYIFMDKNKALVGHWDPEVNPTSPPMGAGNIAATFADDSLMLMGSYYTQFNKVYDTFWHKRKKTMVTIPEVARFVFGKETQEGGEAAPLTFQELYATHMFLTEDVSLMKFEPSVAVRWMGEFMLRTPEEVAMTETVINWFRNDDPRLKHFLDKVKVLIDCYRKGDRTSLTWSDIRFTESDRTIIDFVRQTAFKGYEDLFPSPYLTYLPRLLRPLGAYGDIDCKTAFDFLNEIGIWPSWYNMEINRSAISLTSGGDAERVIVERIKALNPECLQQDFERDIERIKQEASDKNQRSSTVQAVTQESKDRRMNPMVLQSPTEIYRRDPCDSIRHDFGHQPVYAIDDPSASELDDAFSVEPVPITTLTPQPSTWVHVHVADPTSILPPFHEMSLLAAERIQTAYLPERAWTMLPRALTEETLSLKNDGRPKKVMSFSARIADRDGEILEYKVRPGIVRNLRTLNYDEVDKVLSWDRVRGGRAEGNRVRNSVMSMPEVKTLERQYYREAKGTVSFEDQELAQSLLRLQVVAQWHTDARLKQGAFNFSLGRPMIELTPYPLPSIAESGWTSPVDYSQWQEPQISCSLDPSFASPSRLMVAEYMVMAGRVAAKFAQEHSLPLLYRNQAPPLEKYRPEIEGLIKEKVNIQTGMMDMVDILPFRPYISGAEISTASLGHWSMGIKDGYCKVTSPLRRYTDMLAHWQIKGALLSSNPSTTPVFSAQSMVPLAGYIRDRERILGMLEARSVKFWLSEMLNRRLCAGLPNIYEGLVLNPTADGYNVISTMLGFQTVVKAEANDIKELRIGDRVKFEVNNSIPQRPYIGAAHISAL